MSILAWLVVGFLAGALARWVTGAQRGCLATIAVGIVGAFIGGAVYRLATGESPRPSTTSTWGRCWWPCWARCCSCWSSTRSIGAGDAEGGARRPPRALA